MSQRLLFISLVQQVEAWLLPKAQASALAQLIHAALPGLTSLSIERCYWHGDFLRELASASAPPLLLQSITIGGYVDGGVSEAISCFTSLRKVLVEDGFEAIVKYASLPNLEVLLCREILFHPDLDGLGEVLRDCTRLRELEIPCLPSCWYQVQALQSPSLSHLALEIATCSDRLVLAGLPHLQSLSVQTLFMDDDIEALMRANGVAAPAAPTVPPPSLKMQVGCVFVQHGSYRDAAEAMLVAQGWQPAWVVHNSFGLVSSWYKTLPIGPSQQRAAGLLLWRVLNLPSLPDEDDDWGGSSN